MNVVAIRVGIGAISVLTIAVLLLMWFDHDEVNKDGDRDRSSSSGAVTPILSHSENVMAEKAYEVVSNLRVGKNIVKKVSGGQKKPGSVGGWGGAPRPGVKGSKPAFTRIIFSGRMSADMLLRHRDLNPRDVFLDSGAERDLNLIIQEYERKNVIARENASKVGVAEIRALQRQGSLAAEDVTHVEAREEGNQAIKLRRPRTGGMTLVRKGKEYKASSEQLPRSTNMKLLRWEMCKEYGWIILKWFEDRGCLSPNELETQFSRINKRFDYVSKRMLGREDKGK